MGVKEFATNYCPSLLRPMLDRILDSPIGSRLARGVFWSTFGTVSSRAVSLATMVVVARLLGRRAFGEFGMVQSTVAMLGTFAGFGLGLTSTKYIAEYRATNPQRAGRILGLAGLSTTLTSGILAVALALGAPWLATHSLNAPTLGTPLRISAAVLFFAALNGAQAGALAGFEAFRATARANLLAAVVAAPLFIVAAAWRGLLGVVWASAIQFGVLWLLNHLALRREAQRFQVPVAWSGALQELPVLWKFSLPALLAGAMVGPMHWLCGAVIVNQPDGYAEMGLFSAANQWFAILMLVPTLLGGVILPLLAEQVGNLDQRRAHKTLIAAMRINALVVAPIVVLGLLASPWIMALYGPEFRGGWPTLMVVLLTAALLAVQAPVAQLIIAQGHMWVAFLMNLGWALVFVGLNYLWRDAGAWGMASARGVAYLVHTLWTVAYAFIALRRSMTPEPPLDVHDS